MLSGINISESISIPVKYTNDIVPMIYSSCFYVESTSCHAQPLGPEITLH